jgi:hypothetical protein
MEIFLCVHMFHLRRYILVIILVSGQLDTFTRVCLLSNKLEYCLTEGGDVHVEDRSRRCWPLGQNLPHLLCDTEYITDTIRTLCKERKKLPSCICWR